MKRQWGQWDGVTQTPGWWQQTMLATSNTGSLTWIMSRCIKDTRSPFEESGGKETGIAKSFAGPGDVRRLIAVVVYWNPWWNVRRMILFYRKCIGDSKKPSDSVKYWIIYSTLHMHRTHSQRNKRVFSICQLKIFWVLRLKTKNYQGVYGRLCFLSLLIELVEVFAGKCVNKTLGQMMYRWNAA